MKRLGALLLASVLLMGPATAHAEVAKDEIVYAKLALDGTVQSVSIVNGFEADEETQVEDFGAYTRLINLTGEQPLTQSEDSVKLELPSGRFFYQGDRDGLQLPWQLTFTYQLDGKDIEPAVLSGATGELTINLDIKIAETLKAYAEGMTLQLTLSLDGSRARNVQAEKATMAWAGGNITLTYAILPGMEASYRVTARVDNFAMAPIQVAGVRMGMDQEMYRSLAEGQLQDSPLAGAVGNMMENMMRGMAGTPSQSFADARNGQIRGLQFVMMTDEVPGAEPKAEADGSAEEAGEAQNFWQRLAALFRP